MSLQLIRKPGYRGPVDVRYCAKVAPTRHNSSAPTR